MKLFKRKSPVERSEDWTVSEGAFEGGPIIIRVDRGCAGLSETNPIQIGVAIPLNEPVPGGLPSAQEDEHLGVVEQQLLEHVDGRAVLAAVLTTGTMREFVLYARSGDWIEQFHDALGNTVTTHEVQVVAKNDPDWSVYKSLAGG